MWQFGRVAGLCRISKFGALPLRAALAILEFGAASRRFSSHACDANVAIMDALDVG